MIILEVELREFDNLLNLEAKRAHNGGGFLVSDLLFTGIGTTKGEMYCLGKGVK